MKGLRAGPRAGKGSPYKTLLSTVLGAPPFSDLFCHSLLIFFNPGRYQI